MRTNRLREVIALLLLSGCLGLGLSACGSSDSSDGSDRSRTTEITPEKNAPDSAGDKPENAPDDVISDRPGGPGNSKPPSP